MTEKLNSDTQTAEPSPFHSSAVKTTLRQQQIQKLLAHAEYVGVLERKGGEVNDIIREYISKRETPDFDGAKKAIEALTTLKERALLAGQRIAKQNAEALERTKDPLYGTPLTHEMQAQIEAETVDLIHDIKHNTGAVEVAVEDTPPFPGQVTQSELDKYNACNGQPVEDTMGNTQSNAPKTLKDYFKDDSVRKNWWPNARGICAHHGITDSKKQGQHIHEVLNLKKVEGFSLNDFVGTPEEATKLIEQSFASNGANGSNGTAKAEAHWATDDLKRTEVIGRITPAAIAQGFDADPSNVVIEACKALGIEKLEDFQGTGKAFITEIVKLWKSAEDAADKSVDETKADPPADKSDQETEADDEPAETVKKLEPHPILAEVKTLTGIPVGRISEAMNRRFPKEAYAPIPSGPMKDKTDLGFEYVRDRFDQVFGPHGFGWKFEPHPVLGKVEYRADKLTSKEGREYTRHAVTFVCHVFKYAVMVGDQLTWIEVSPMSDSDSNEDQGYAYRGAFTSLLKQALRGFGGINHILKGEYTHKQAKVS